MKRTVNDSLYLCKSTGGNETVLTGICKDCHKDTLQGQVLYLSI